MSLRVICPEGCEKAYLMAADIFCDMYKYVTGRKIERGTEDDGKSELVVIGHDAVNTFLMNEMLRDKTPELGIKYGTDDYCMKSFDKDGRHALILAGGRGRSTVYAVYDYFERFMGCRYFWDGDVIPKNEDIVIENIDVNESPRFYYRGLRYFAHRGLKRFQAEHWSFEDWKTEIDWMMKKRLNFFMLRIGMDDIWQKAFPNEVPYPEGYRTITDEVSYQDGYDNRSDFWTLKYRGELRKKIMDYAKDLDVMSPTDTGTMTHWYSRTPREFLEKKKPLLMEQADTQYNKYDTGRVFDFRINENMDYYSRLTQTMAEEYDNNNYLFHSIGLGERRIFKDDRKNFNLKKLCYRKISEELRKNYPNSKLMLATWDFTGWWRPHEVQEFVKELDPRQTVLLDYTSDGTDERQCFKSWGVVNNFPWIYGLFHAYEPETELRGPYDRTDERLRTAASDPYCEGMILWPEVSHSDPLILEYLSQNAWAPLKTTVEDILKNYCLGRYGKFGEEMNESWQAFLPFMKLSSWGGYNWVNDGAEPFKTNSYWCTHSDIFVKPVWFIRGSLKSQWISDYYEKTTAQALEMTDTLKAVIKAQARINERTDDKFILRDSIDIVRTACGRFLNYLFAKCTYGFGERIDYDRAEAAYMRLIRLLADLLWKGTDFSVYDSLTELKAVAPVNPDFERILKENILNEYCVQYCAELIDNVFISEAKNSFKWFSERGDFSELWKKSQEIFEKFRNTSLESMQRTPEKSVSEIMDDIAEAIAAVAELLK